VLPERYQDQTETDDATRFFNELSTVFYSLPENLRQTLTPYLLRPDNPNSYIYQTIVSQYTPQMTKSSVRFADKKAPDSFDFKPFNYIDTSDGYLRIWHHYIPDDPRNNKWKQQAQELAADLDGKAYARFYDLLGKHPPYDLDFGGNERLDLYLMDSQVKAVRAWRSSNYGDFIGKNIAQGNIFNTSSFSIINTNYTRKAIRGIAAHEMFHMFQRSFISLEYNYDRWWTEATATFAMQLVYPDDDTERPALPFFIDYPHISVMSVKNKHDYGAYLFPFFLTRSFGEPFFASIFYDNDGKSFIIDTIENKLGSFDDEWKEFVLLNTLPNDYYDESKPFAVNQSFAGHPNKRNLIFTPGRLTAEIPALEPLSAYLIEVSLESDDFKKVSFSNLADYNNQGTHTAMQALIYTAPEHKLPSGLEDWSDLPKKDYFFAQDNDRFHRILILLSNADPIEKTTPSRLFIETKNVVDFGLHHSETRKYTLRSFEGVLWDFHPTFTIDGIFVGTGAIPEALHASPSLGLYTASWLITGLPTTFLDDPTKTMNGTVTFDLSEAYDKIRYGFSDIFFINDESGDHFAPAAGSLIDWDENGATISLPYSAIIGKIISCPGCNNEVIDESPVYIKIVKE